jgi:hypothetical protein
VTGDEPTQRSSGPRVAAVLALYLTTVGAAAVVLLTPSTDPWWAAVVAAAGSVALSCGTTLGVVAARRRGASAAAVTEAVGTGMIAAAVGCGLLLSLGLRGHYPLLMFSCLAAAVLLGFGPALVARRRRLARR